MRRAILLSVLILVSCVSSSGGKIANEEYLYKAMLVRAAPGKLLDFIALYKARMPVYDASGDERPFWMRHSQGDHWDIMFLFPMESYSEYYKPGRMEKRQKAAKQSEISVEEFTRKFYEYVAWHEEVFVKGASLEEVKKAFEGSAFFHVEMFQALPNKHDELYREREMENAYLKAINRPQNLIFVHDQGAAWNMFTIGFYRDIKHYAESADIPHEKEDEAARFAGFEGVDRIGTYLRTLISRHNDTLAVTVK